jgi:hypothetical protein
LSPITPVRLTAQARRQPTRSNKVDKAATKEKAIGEVTQASIVGFTFEVWQSAKAESPPPAFGSFVTTASQIVGVVCNVSCQPRDNMHKPRALKMDREQLKAEQPQIFVLLETTVQALCIGFFENKEFKNYLPPLPASIHDFVYLATQKEIQTISEGFDFMRLVSQVKDVPADELLAATIRQAYLSRGSDSRFLVDAGKSLANFYGDDYDRLMSVLTKIKP